MTGKAIYFITGSTGAGKTTLLKGVVKAACPNLSAHHLDDLGIPTVEEMNARYGGPANWQAYNVRRWIENVIQTDGADLVVLDGQARPSIIMDAANEAGFSAIHVTLIDGSHAERRRRLLVERTQPELDMLDTYAWAAYLRGQADALKLEIIDTTGMSLPDSVRCLAGSIRRFAEEKGIHLDWLDDP